MVGRVEVRCRARQAGGEGVILAGDQEEIAAAPGQRGMGTSGPEPAFAECNRTRDQPACTGEAMADNRDKPSLHVGTDETMNLPGVPGRQGCQAVQESGHIP